MRFHDYLGVIQLSLKDIDEKFMRYIFLVGLAALSITCLGQGDNMDFKKFEWLTGTWNRTNISKPGRTAYEVWSKEDGGKLTCHGGILQGKDTIFVERFSILAKDNAIYYVADVPENKQVVYFKITEITDLGFVCENPEHDFPKKIEYKFHGGQLKAQISGNGKYVDYLFLKQK